MQNFRFAPQIPRLPFAIDDIVRLIIRTNQDIILPAWETYRKTHAEIIEVKDPDNIASLATQADLDAEIFLIKEARKLAPHVLAYGEETALKNPHFYRDIKRYPCLIFDPVDGTASLVQGSKNGKRLYWDGFATMAVYVENGQIIMAIVHRPLAEGAKTFVAIPGHGIWIDGKKFKPSKNTGNTIRFALDYIFSVRPSWLKREGLPIMSDRIHSNHHAEWAAVIPVLASLTWPGPPWDLAVIAAFCRAAGGDLLSVRTKKPYKLSRPNDCYVTVPHRNHLKRIYDVIQSRLGPEIA